MIAAPSHSSRRVSTGGHRSQADSAATQVWLARYNALLGATDLEGNRFTRTGAGLLARCWQHEYDHLDGTLILDRMSQLSRLKNRLAVKRLERDATL